MVQLNNLSAKATVYLSDIRTSPASMTVFRRLTDKHTPPSSWKARLVIPLLDSTTNRLPAESNCIERGLVRPVATKAIRYPEATVGRTEFLGAGVVEQPVAAKTGITAAARKVAQANWWDVVNVNILMVEIYKTVQKELQTSSSCQKATLTGMRSANSGERRFATTKSLQDKLASRQADLPKAVLTSQSPVAA